MSLCLEWLTHLSTKGAKRSVKMWTTNFYKSYLKKHFVVHWQLAVKNSVSTYVCYTPDGFFWLNLYIYAFFNLSELQIKIERKIKVYREVIIISCCSPNRSLFNFNYLLSPFFAPRSCHKFSHVLEKEHKASKVFYKTKVVGFQSCQKLIDWNYPSTFHKTRK